MRGIVGAAIAKGWGGGIMACEEPPLDPGGDRRMVVGIFSARRPVDATTRRSIGS